MPHIVVQNTVPLNYNFICICVDTLGNMTQQILLCAHYYVHYYVRILLLLTYYVHMCTSHVAYRVHAWNKHGIATCGTHVECA